MNENPFEGSGSSKEGFQKRNPEEGEEENGGNAKIPTSLSRRDFFRRTAEIAGGAAALGLAGKGVVELFDDGDDSPSKILGREIRDHTKMGSYDSGNLAGRNVGEPFRMLLGNLPADPKFEDIIYIIPPRIEVNFSERLDALWEYKKKISANSRVVPEVAEAITSEYKENSAFGFSIQMYVEKIDQLIAGIKNAEGFWGKVAEIKGLNKEEAELVESICRSFDGKDLMAYALTELMPSSDGELNKGVMDFLLNNAGREYVEAIPALGDDKTSFGPYQLTEYAVYDAERQRGASIVNRALPKDLRIPGSVSKLRNDDHHKAAYLFAVDNIANLVNMASRINKLDVLNKVWRQKHLEIVQIIATAHHGPSAVISGIPQRRGRRKAGIAEMWLQNDARSDFTVSTYGNYSTYARKTKANFEALGSVVSPAPSAPEPEDAPVKEEEGEERRPASLKNTGAMNAEHAATRKYNLSKMETDESVARMLEQGRLVKIPRRGKGFYVDEIGVVYPGQRDVLYTARPWVKKFLEEEARLFDEAFPGARFKVTALTRSEEYQKFLRTCMYKGKRVPECERNVNASSRSNHPTGAVIDISKFLTPNGTPSLRRKLMSVKQLKYMRERLLELEATGKILVTEESTQQGTFHIFVLPEYKKK